MPKKQKKSFGEYSLMQQLIPEEFQFEDNPLSSLLESISFKHFFSSLFRKIGEEFHSNHFDTTFTSFELKIGFGAIQISPNLLEHYYCYSSLAHLNSWLSYSPMRIIGFLQIIFVGHFCEPLQSDKQSIKTFAKTLQLRCTAFLYHVKEIPSVDPAQEMRWCVNSFFEMWGMVYHNSGPNKILDPKLKDTFLTEGLEYFFLLTCATRWFGEFQPYGKNFQPLQSYCEQWKHMLKPEIVQEVLTHYHTQVHSSSWTQAEISFTLQSYPQESYIDSLIQMYPKSVGIQFFQELFVAQELQEKLHNIMTAKQNFYDFIFWIGDPHLAKKQFVHAARKFSSYIASKKYSKEEETEIANFLTSLQHGKIHVLFNMPKALKRESELMNILLQFYLYHTMSGFSYSPDFIFFQHNFSQVLEKVSAGSQLSPVQSLEEKQILQSILHQYASNSFYYVQTYTQILAGSDKFTIPYFPKDTSLPPETILQEIHNQHLPMLFQDFLAKPMSQEASKKEIKLFQKSFQTKIEKIIGLSFSDHIELWFGHILDIATRKLCIIDKESHHILLKHHLYDLDAWLWLELSKRIVTLIEIKTVQHVGLQHITQAMIRQSVLGVMIFIHYLDQHTLDLPKRQFLLDIVDEILIREIRLLPFSSMRAVALEYRAVLGSYRPLIDILVHQQGTLEMCAFALESLKILIDNVKKGEIIHIGHEDVIWFREFLKHLQYFSQKSYKPIL